MADTTYRVNVKYDVDTANAETGMNRLLSLAEKLAAAVGIGMLIGKIIDVGSAAENTRISLAGMMQAGKFPGITKGVEGFNTALGMSDELMKKIRIDSAAYIGTASDLTEMVKSAMLPGAHAGLSVNQIEKLAFNVGSFAKSQGIDAATASHELAMMLEGNARKAMPLFRKMAPMMDGGGDSFNTKSAADRVKQIDKALESSKPMIAAYANTWTAISTTTETWIRSLFKAGTAGVFFIMKDTLAAINVWLDKNGASIERFARRAGSAIADVIGGAINWIADVASSVGPSILAFIGGALDGAAFAAAVLWKGLGYVADAFWWVSDRVMDFASAMLELVGLQYDANDAGDHAADVMEAFGRAVGAGAIALGVITAATWLWEGAQWAINLAMLANPIGLLIVGVVALGAGVAALVLYWDKVAIATEKALLNTMKFLVATGIGDKTALLGGMGDVGIDLAKREDDLRRKDRNGRGGLTARFEDTYLKPYGMSLPNIGGASGKGAVPGDLNAAAMLDKRALASHHTTINNNIKIAQTIENAHDPDRVLVKTKEALDQILRHPIESPTNRVATRRAL